MRMGPGGTRWHVLFQLLQHDVAPFPVDLSDGQHVLVNKTIFRHFIGNDLVEGWCLQVGALFGLHHFGDDFRRGDDPGQTHSRSQRFGESAQIDYIAAVAAILIA